MGGGPKIQTVQPAPPPQAPSATAQLTEYIQNYPRLVELQRQYNPELAQLDFQLAEQFAPQYTQLAQDVQSQIYPETSKLQENLAAQALQGMGEPLPDWARQQYTSDFNAGIGMNANAPIGVSERNLGLMRLQKEWQDYYRNLGLSVAQRQPLQQTASPGFQNAGAQENINPYLSYGASTYGTQMAGYGSQQANTLAYQRSGFFNPQGALSGAAMGAPIPFIGPAGGALLGGFGR